ncbi:MAG TPA: type II secretion system secretin GspD [Burkholderiaceae bacterium]|nr:type II secretion system secretin GspD [Burkholderiaceae bacterium]
MNKHLHTILSSGLLLVLLYSASARSIAAESAPGSAGQNAKPALYSGNDRVFAAPSHKPLDATSLQSVRFEDAPARDVVHAILGDILKAEFLMHSPLDGRVTIVSHAAVTADQALYLLEAALHAMGQLVVRDVRGTFHVGKPDALRAVVPNVRAVSGVASQLAPGYGPIVVPLKYIGAAEMAAILRPMATADSIARVDTVRNLLVLVGSRAQAEGWLSLVSTFDVDLLKSMSVGVFPLKHVTVKDMEAALQLLGGDASGTPPVSPVMATGSPAASQASASGSVGLAASNPLTGVVRILPVERLNSVIVVTPRAAYLEEARQWIEKLDKPDHNSAEARLHVYQVKNGSAKQLAEVLNGVYGTQAGAGTPAVSGVAPALTPVSVGVSARPAVSSPASNAAAVSTAVRGAQSNAAAQPVSTVQLGASVRVVADEMRNALIIYAPPGQLDRIEAALAKLDTPAKQVLIEASIVEVTLTDELSYGTQWLFSNSRAGGGTGDSLLTTNPGGTAIGSALTGFSYTLRSAAGNVRAVLNALSDKSLVKVISTPSLMVLDNHTATIVVGNQQPIRSSETVTDGGVRSSSIQYKDTGVSLAVKPSVNAGSMVTMQINQSVTDVGAVDLPTGQRAFLQRQIDSKVAVRSGESLVLGGLIRDNNTDGSAGVPGLHEVPVLGALFGTKTRSATQTELLVIITPRVVQSDNELREAGDEIKQRMRKLTETLNHTQ